MTGEKPTRPVSNKKPIVFIYWHKNFPSRRISIHQFSCSGRYLAIKKSYECDSNIYYVWICTINNKGKRRFV